MRFLKYLGRLLKEFMGFAWQNKAWWIIPMVLIFLLLALVIISTQSIVPTCIYALF
ncbi:DUF5989 family protein [Verrucomicrobiota bacterium]